MTVPFQATFKSLCGERHKKRKGRRCGTEVENDRRPFLPLRPGEGHSPRGMAERGAQQVIRPVPLQ